MSRRVLIMSLLISVALNCALAGLLVGDRYFGRARAIGDVAAVRIAEVVPVSARPAVREAMRAHRFELLEALRDVRRARAELRQYAAQEPLPRDELARSMAELREATVRMQTTLHAAMLEGLSTHESRGRDPRPTSVDARAD